MKNQSRYHSVIIALICLCLQWTACNSGPEKQASSSYTMAEILHEQQDQLTEVIIYDVFTPPVASRIYAYSSLASYEALRFIADSAASLTEKMNGFPAMPIPEEGKQYDFILAANKAFMEVARKLVFSVDSLDRFESAVDEQFRTQLATDVYQNSVSFGKAVASGILERANQDHYLSSRGKPKYLGSDEPGKWRPTPPDYQDGVEFCWNEMKTLLMDSASQFLPPPPPSYSTDTNSVFFQEVLAVYRNSKQADTSHTTIARFWDDNPFVVQHTGHLMMGNKKITPGGHWMGITAIACKMTHADPLKIARSYAITATALYEGFISSWDAKYKWSFVRPVTVINEYIDKTWTPYLQTPPFPEYTSAHSTITAAAATVLTALYGPSFSFQDTSDLRYIGMERHFDSFLQASDETSISRFYGGIHYKISVDNGAMAGRKIGRFIIDQLKL